MLLLTLLASTLVAVTIATTDPEAAMCGDRCAAWDDLQDKCIDKKGCWGLNGGEYDARVGNCLSQCWPVAAPCHQACHVAFTFCQSECPANRRDNVECFYTCYENKFQEELPPLPTQEE